MMPRVLNSHHGLTLDEQRNAIYIGRGSPWGNPFPITSERTREQAIAEFEEYFTKDPMKVQAAKEHLKGLNLICFCAPKPCHGDILLRIANED